MLFPVPVNQSFEQLVVGCRPETFFPPGGERFGSGQGSRLPLKDIHVVLEFQHILLMSVAPFVTAIG
jgi:hypothetical protein